MTRIIAIVVVIAAAVVAYMYTSASDVEIDRDIEATSTQPADGDAHSEVTDVPLDTVAEGLEEGTAEVIEDTPIAETAEEAAEDVALEGAEGEAELEAVTEAEVLDDTAEPLPGEVGLADEEPNEGVGAVSNEEETAGAGFEGIVADDADQEGLPGEITDEASAEEPLAVEPTEESAAPAEAAEAIMEEAGAAGNEDPGPALRTDLADPAEATDLDTIFDEQNFDPAAVAAAIEGSGLGASEQAELTAALATAQDDPTLLPEVLARIRAALLEGQ